MPIYLSHLVIPQIESRTAELSETQNVKEQLLVNTQKSVGRGTFGSPTFYVGDEIFFGKDRLRDVEKMIMQMK
jgi:2-hydroxychromene-2-carboxylate isomerase